MMLCPDCKERPKLVELCGKTRPWCRECKNARARARYRDLHQGARIYIRKALPRLPAIPASKRSPVPMHLREELAGFARELGFGR